MKSPAYCMLYHLIHDPILAHCDFLWSQGKTNFLTDSQVSNYHAKFLAENIFRVRAFSNKRFLTPAAPLFVQLRGNIDREMALKIEFVFLRLLLTIVVKQKLVQ